MRVGSVREIKEDEYRVGLTPESAGELVARGHDVWIEAGAGQGIGALDDEYLAVGCVVQPDARSIFEACELIVKVKEPIGAELTMLREGQVLFTYLHLAPSPGLVAGLLDSGVTAIAYETVTDALGQLPLLKPMRQVAGRMSIQAGATALEKEHGGRGVLLGGVPGVLPAKVAIIGGGTVGFNAAQMAVGLGADVTILDRDPNVLEYLGIHFENMAKTRFSNAANLAESVIDADLVIGAVLVPGAATPKLVTRELLPRMKRGSVLVDVAIDQGGCFETSRPTTHSDPTFVAEGIVHYCVANIPGAVARTSTYALNNVTLPHVMRIADRGWKDALAQDPHLANGLNIHDGHVTHEAVARDQGLHHVPVSSIL